MQTPGRVNPSRSKKWHPPSEADATFVQYLRSSSIWSSAKGSILLGGTPVSWVALKDFATFDVHHSVIGQRDQPTLDILD